MSDRWNVLLPKQIDPSGPAAIDDFAECTSTAEYDSYEDALADIDRYDAVIVRVAPLDADVISRADRLKVIAKHGTGLHNVDMDAASERGIVVCNTPGANAQSVAEHAIARQRTSGQCTRAGYPTRPAIARSWSGWGSNRDATDRRTRRSPRRDDGEETRAGDVICGRLRGCVCDGTCRPSSTVSCRWSHRLLPLRAVGTGSPRLRYEASPVHTGWE